MNNPPIRRSTSELTLVSVQRTALYLVLLSVVLNATGQILFKFARTAQAGASLFSLFWQIETWLGFIFYGLSSVIWLWVLSRTQLSYAYPILSLTFPIVVALSVLLFGESVPIMRWLGVVTIIIGVSMLART